MEPPLSLFSNQFHLCFTIASVQCTLSGIFSLVTCDSTTGYRKSARNKLIQHLLHNPLKMYVSLHEGGPDSVSFQSGQRQSSAPHCGG